MTPVIHSEVDKLCDKAPVTRKNLQRLEKRIGKKILKPIDEDQLSTSQLSGVSSYTMGSVRSVASRSSVGSRASRASGRPREPDTGAGLGGMAIKGKGQTSKEEDASLEDFEWAKLDEYASYLHEQDAMRQKLGIVDMQQRMRDDLDRQLADARLKKQRQIDEEARYFTAQVQEIEQWKILEQQKVVDIRAKNVREKEMRDEQLELNQALKTEEVERRRRTELELVDKINREIDAERGRVTAKKTAQRAAMVKIMGEVKQAGAEKEKIKAKQAALDQQSMAAYNKVLDAQDKKRADELKSRLDRQGVLMKRMESGVVAQQEAKSDDDARRAQQQREEADARAIEMESNKQERLQIMRLESQEFLFKQMAEKDEKKRQALELKKLQATILDADTQEYMEIEQARADDRKNLNVEHRKELERHIQLRAKQDFEDKFNMSKEEVRLNKRLLTVVDRTLKERDAAVEELGMNKPANDGVDV